MEKINLRDINFEKLKRLQQQGSKSIVYTDGTYCYKILTDYYEIEKQRIYEKFFYMENLKLDNVLLPKGMIVEDGILQGYIMDYFQNSTTLLSRFARREFNCKELFEYVYRASIVLRNIHKSGIVWQDLSFENILVNDNKNVMFCDIDGCSYNGINSPYYSMLLANFMFKFRRTKIKDFVELDKLSMILSFYNTLYCQVLQRITKKQYHVLSDNISTLETLRPIANMLIDKNCPIERLPYLDEVINLSDDFEIDRKKVMTLRQKLFKI